MKRKAFKSITRSELAETTRKRNAWHAVNSADQPKFSQKPGSVFENEPERRSRMKANRASRAIVLYAAELGRKRGVLPYDLSAWEASHNFDYSGFDAPQASVLVVFRDGVSEVPIRVENLDWQPAEPVEECVE
ncbi:MAG: hypothetical protein ABSH36_08450 [Solirubrobacteraceae bacterium]